MKFQNIIENYINGNLKDFCAQYACLKRTAAFWSYVIENYGDETATAARNFLTIKGF